MFSKSGEETRMAQIIEIAGGEIHKINLVFDANAFASQVQADGHIAALPQQCGADARHGVNYSLVSL